MKKTVLIMALHCIGVAMPTLLANSVSGQLRIIGRSERALVTTIVFAEPLDSSAPSRPGRYIMTQRNKTFVPRVLAITVGSTVEFPNADPIFHNVFSLSRPSPFDLGLYRAGLSKSRVFTKPATYRLFCNIHPQMVAIILVLPTPFFAEAGVDGNFRLEAPTGRYRITAWSERSQPASTEITVSSGAVVVPELALDESNFAELPHKNKFNQNYPKSAYDAMKDKKEP